jgi:hypothetical protein
MTRIQSERKNQTNPKPNISKSKKPIQSYPDKARKKSNPTKRPYPILIQKPVQSNEKPKIQSNPKKNLNNPIQSYPKATGNPNYETVTNTHILPENTAPLLRGVFFV